MGDTHQTTIDDVRWAIQMEATDWKREALRALHKTYAKHANSISEVPPTWKAAAAFSFCTGAVEKLFPASKGAAMISQAAIPIWIYTEATKVYDDIYKNQAREANKLLAPIHNSFVTAFASAIDEAETGLVGSKYGKAIAAQMQQAIAQRQFSSRDEARTHIRRAIDKSLILDDSHSTHEKQYEAALGKTMDKISHVYAGTWDAPGRNALYLLRLKEAECGSDAKRWHAFQRSIKIDDIDVEAEKGLYKAELTRLKGRFNGKVDCAIPIDTIAHGNVGATTGAERALKIIANIDKYEVYRDPANFRLGTGETFVWEKEQPNFSIHSVANTFNNSLPAQAMNAFVNAERKIWNNRRA